MLYFIAIIACFIILAAILGAVVFGLINNTKVPLTGKKAGFVVPKNILAVFAHPDDEIMVAGSLAKWKKGGATVHLFYFTHGEDGPTGGLVEKKDLGPQRAAELKAVAGILKADSLTILDYPDRYLNTIPAEVLQAELKEAINKLHPDTVICFDNTIGLYGHTDHAFSGLCTQNFLLKNPTTVRQQLVMTLCPKMIALAQKVSKTFRERYKPENGLPAANMAVAIRHFGRAKKQVCLAHKTQHQVVGDVQPYVTKLPSFLYYRLFSREYYHFSTLNQKQ
ncbi:MAG: PIG-L family deacetylase [Oscillospiraceae bacterium]